MRTPANTYKSQFTFGYDSIYTGDWRFIPSNISTSSVSINSGITNKYFTSSNLLTNTGETCYLNFMIPANSPIIMITFTIDDSNGFDTGFTISYDSSNGIDGNWSNIPFFLQNAEYHNNINQNIIFETKTGNTYVNLQWINSYTSGTLIIKDIGIFKLNTKKYLKNDIWLAMGASLQYAAFDTTIANNYARNKFNRDPLIINMGYPGKTIEYLRDNLQNTLNNNPYASVIFIHSGGNNVSNLRPFSTSSQESLNSIRDSLKRILLDLDKKDIISIVGRISFRNYPDEPIVDDGVYEENGSLPFNENIIDIIIKNYSKRTYDSYNDIGILDLYGLMFLNLETLNPDGIHLSSEAVTIWSEYCIDVVGDYVYNKIKSPPLFYRTWLESCEYYTTIAESSGLYLDITTAQNYVSRLPDGSNKNSFQTRIDNIICVDCNIVKVYMNFGSQNLTGWNTFPGRNSGTTLTSLIDNASNITSIALKINSAWNLDGAGLTTSGYQTGNNSGYFPDLVLSSGWYSRDVEKDLTFYNLDSGKTYNIKLLPSVSTAGKRLTSYRYNSNYIYIDAENNYLNYASFNNISPDINNEIQIFIRNAALYDPVNESSGYGYVNGLEISWNN